MYTVFGAWLRQLLARMCFQVLGSGLDATGELGLCVARCSRRASQGAVARLDSMYIWVQLGLYMRQEISEAEKARSGFLLRV